MPQNRKRLPGCSRQHIVPESAVRGLCQLQRLQHSAKIGLTAEPSCTKSETNLAFERGELLRGCRQLAQALIELLLGQGDPLCKFLRFLRLRAGHGLRSAQV